MYTQGTHKGAGWYYPFKARNRHIKAEKRKREKGNRKREDGKPEKGRRETGDGRTKIGASLRTK